MALNAKVLWNTCCLDVALTQLRADGQHVDHDDLDRLSPHIHEHVNLLGRYHFIDPASTNDQLRPIRDLTTAAELSSKNRQPFAENPVPLLLRPKHALGSQPRAATQPFP